MFVSTRYLRILSLRSVKNCAQNTPTLTQLLAMEVHLNKVMTIMITTIKNNEIKGVCRKLLLPKLATSHGSSMKYIPENQNRIIPIVSNNVHLKYILSKDCKTVLLKSLIVGVTSMAM